MNKTKDTDTLLRQAVGLVKTRLWQQGYRVIDLTRMQTIRNYDLEVDGKWRVKVGLEPIATMDEGTAGGPAARYDVYALVQKTKTTGASGVKLWEIIYFTRPPKDGMVRDKSPRKVFGEPSNN